MKHDRAPPGDRLKGSEFREIAEDLQALVGGKMGPEPVDAKPPANPVADPHVAPVPNVPLKESKNERGHRSRP